MNRARIWNWLVKQRILPILDVLLLVTVSVGTRDFWTVRNLQNLVVAVSIEGVIAVGMTVVMVGGGIDLSVGSVMALAGVLAVSMQRFGIVGAIVIAVLAAGLCGACSGLLVTRLGINPFIATLGMMLVARGVVMSYTDAQPVANANLLFTQIARGKLGLVPIPGLVFLAALLLGHWFLKYTRLGRDIYALGGNEEAARASGIRTERVKLAAYVLAGLSAGVAGVLLASRLSTGSPVIGEDTALNVITAVLLGGTSLTGGVGSMPGTLTGLLTVGVLSNSLNLFNVPAYYQRIAKGMLLILVVFFDSLYVRYRRQALLRTRGKASEERLASAP